MSTLSFEYEFKIGETVYHKSEDEATGKGTVIDIIHSVVNGRTRYLVSFGISEYDEKDCSEFELSKEKPLEI